MPRKLLFALVLSSFAFVAVPAQSCGPNEVLLVNDDLPALPAGFFGTSVIQGLCEGESCGAVFDVSGIAPTVKVNLAAVGLGAEGGVNGNLVQANLRIFDGVTFNGAIANLGPVVFDFSAATGASIGLTSTAVNTQDISNFNVQVSSGKLVVVWDMAVNPHGNCSSGFTTNFATDFENAGGSCDPLITPPQKNLIFITGQGFRDAALATVGGFQLCPMFYAGNWLIRACVEPALPTDLLSLDVTGSPGSSGNLINIGLSAPAFPGQFYFIAPALTTTPVSPTALGDFPLAFDPLLNFYVTNPALVANFFFNFSGALDPSGAATATILVPPVAAGFAFVVGGVVFNPTFTAFDASTDATSPTFVVFAP